MCALKIIICMRVKSKNIVVLRFGVSEDLLPTQVGFLKLFQRAHILISNDGAD